MNSQSDSTLHDLISKAGTDLYYAVMRSLEGERGHHQGTAIAAAGYLAGTAIRMSLDPAVGAAVVRQIMDQVGAATPPADFIPPGHQPALLVCLAASCHNSRFQNSAGD